MKPTNNHELVKFNLNDSVYVKLSKEGIKIMYDFYSCIGSEAKTLIEDKIDENGYIKFQAWHFMQIFGSKLNLGLTPPFETNVYFNKIDIEELKDENT